MQINLKKSNYLISEQCHTGERPLKENRDKSTNCQKNGKFYSEFAKIISESKSRGVSADEMMKPPQGKQIDKQSKTVKSSKSKLMKGKI